MVQSYLTVSDFDAILNEYAGRLLAHSSATTRISNIGGDENTEFGSASQIKAYFIRTDNKKEYDKAGLVKVGNGILLSKYSDGVKFNDLIYTDGDAIQISSVDGDADSIDVVTASDHALSVGDEVLILGTTNYNGKYTVASTADSTHFTISDSNHNLGAESVGVAMQDFSTFQVKEAFDVPGVFDVTEGDTDFIYTACSLFLYDEN